MLWQVTQTLAATCSTRPFCKQAGRRCVRCCHGKIYWIVDSGVGLRFPWLMRKKCEAAYEAL